MQHSITAALSATDKKLAKLIDLYTADTIPVQILNERVAKLNAEKDALESELNTLQNVPLPDLSIEKANKLLDGFQAVLASGDHDLIRNFVRSLIDHIVIRGDEVEIHWKFTVF